MRNITLRVRGGLPVLASTLSLLAVGAAQSFAQTATPAPGAVDYSALATATKTEVQTAIGSSAPVAFTLLAVLLGVGIAWKFIKKGAKSS